MGWVAPLMRQELRGVEGGWAAVLTWVVGGMDGFGHWRRSSGFARPPTLHWRILVEGCRLLELRFVWTGGVLDDGWLCWLKAS